MFKLSAMILLAMFAGRVPTDVATHLGKQDDLGKQDEIRSKLTAGSPSEQVSVTTLLDLPKPPPVNAYAITGELLPPFLKAVLFAWQREFPKLPLSANGIIFVIRPSEFYADLDPEQRSWLASREMLGIQNFPLIINPLPPGDDWYLQAQEEWKQGNQDAIYVMLTSLFHEITHTRLAGNERAAYKDQLDLFEQLRRRGKLTSPYARFCLKSLRYRYSDMLKHPDRYVQVQVRFQHKTVALLIHPSKTPQAPLPPGRDD